MADLEILTLCISFNISQCALIFARTQLKGIVCTWWKIQFSTAIRFQIDFISHTLLLWAWYHVKFVSKYSNMGEGENKIEQN